MARPRQPEEVAKLKGAHKVHPERYRGTIVKSDLPLGEAPDHLSPEGQAVWFELAALALPGVMTGADRILFEVVSELVAEYRQDRREFPIGKHAILKGHMATMGLNPSDRQKFRTDKPKNENPFDEF